VLRFDLQIIAAFRGAEVCKEISARFSPAMSRTTALSGVRE
jgi:hypothetical protein